MRVRLTDPTSFETRPSVTDIIAWATSDNGGGLPGVSAHPFAQYIHCVWDEYVEEDDKSQTNEIVLEGAVAFWTGQA